MAIRANAPDVDIMNVANSCNFGKTGTNALGGRPLRRAFQKYIQGLTDDSKRGPENQAGNPNGKSRIDPGLTGPKNHPATHDDRGGGKRVAELVNKGATDVYVMGSPEQHPGDSTIHHYANHCNPDHDSRMHRDWVPHSKKSFIEDIKGDCHQREGIHESSQHTGAVVAKCFSGAGRTCLDEDCDP